MMNVAKEKKYESVNRNGWYVIDILTIGLTG